MTGRRLILITIICLGVLLYTSGRCYSEQGESEILDSLIEEALENNPKIQSEYERWQAAEYRIRNVQGLPDSTLKYSYFGESVETRVGPQKNKYGVSQKVPFPGKLGLKGKAQSKHAEMLREKYEAARREVIKEVKFTYYDIFWVDRAIEVTDGEKIVLEGLESVAQRKFESNLAPQQDVIKVQLELSKLIDKLYVLQQSRRSLEAKLNRILYRPYGSEQGEIPEVVPSEFEYSLKQLRDMGGESRQELLAANLDIERAEYEKSLAKMDYLPDFNLGLDYIQVGSGHTTMPNDGQDAWMGTVAVSVPIWFDKLDAGLKEKKAQVRASEKNYESVKNSISYEIEDLFFKLNTYKDTISLYKTALIPQSEQAFEAAQTSYETGQVDLLNWIDAERVLLQLRIAYYKMIADYQKSIAYLERVVGRDL